METLKTLAKENAEKQSWVRKSVTGFMSAWKDLTQDCETVRSAESVHIGDSPYTTERFYLVTGQDEIKAYDDEGRGYDVHDTRAFEHVLPVKDLRALCAKLPDAITSIEKQLAKANSDNDLLIGKLDALIDIMKS